jgi:hypothetical protein
MPSSNSRRRNYGPLVQQLRAESVKSERQRSLQPDTVAEIVERALIARRAPTRRLVGRDARARALLARLLPDRAMDAVIAVIQERLVSQSVSCRSGSIRADAPVLLSLSPVAIPRLFRHDRDDCAAASSRATLRCFSP